MLRILDHRRFADLLAFRVRLGLCVLALGRRSGAERRDLDDLTAEMHVREAEPPADEATVTKQAPHILGQRIGRHVKILGREPQEQIAHRPPDEERLVPRVLQPVKNLQGIGRDGAARDRVLGARNHHMRDWRRRYVQKN